MKMRIPKNSTALIKWQNSGGFIQEGLVLDTKGNCVQIQTTETSWFFFKKTVVRWYSFDCQLYSLVVDEVDVDKK